MHYHMTWTLDLISTWPELWTQIKETNIYSVRIVHRTTALNQKSKRMCYELRKVTRSLPIKLKTFTHTKHPQWTLVYSLYPYFKMADKKIAQIFVKTYISSFILPNGGFSSKKTPSVPWILRKGSKLQRKSHRKCEKILKLICLSFSPHNTSILILEDLNVPCTSMTTLFLDCCKIGVGGGACQWCNHVSSHA